MPDLRIDDPDAADLPPAAKLVYLVLQETGPCSKAQLRVRTQLPDGTVRGALEDLVEDDLVESLPSEDARSRSYRVARE